MNDEMSLLKKKCENMEIETNGAHSKTTLCRNGSMLEYIHT